MTEKGLFIVTDGIAGIPSDTPSRCELEVVTKYDYLIQFTDNEKFVPLPGIRFRTSGSSMEFICEELSILTRAFRENNGQIPPDYQTKIKKIDTLPSLLDISVQVGKEPSESRYIIKGIPDDNAGPEDDTRFKSMDIEITKEGNAIVTVHDNRRNNQASMEFKTAENGGKFPIMAEVFTRIAERIAKAKKKQI